jgi:hypothetical protein
MAIFTALPILISFVAYPDLAKIFAQRMDSAIKGFAHA